MVMSPTLRVSTAILTLAFAGSCKRADPAPQPAASVTTDSRTVLNDDSQPNYPVVVTDPDPAAALVCAALQDRPRERRAICKGTTPGVSFAGLCTSALSAAIRSDAVHVDAAAASVCARAIDRSLGACDTIGLVDGPAPAECNGFVHGLLREGAKCRSSLECIEGLRCQGVGPTSVGHCGRPLPDGAACGVAVDALVTYVRQDRVDQAHPECSGFCSDHRCSPRAPRGGACRATVGCSAGDICASGRCAAPTL
jgi:hypothetical protein